MNRRRGQRLLGGNRRGIARFLVWEAMQQGVPPLPAILLGIAGTAVISLLIEGLNHGRLASRQGAFAAHFISSLGIYIIIVQFVAVVWGNDPKVLHTDLDPIAQFGPVFVSHSDLWLVGGCIAMIAGFFAWLRFSDVGCSSGALRTTRASWRCAASTSDACAFSPSASPAR